MGWKICDERIGFNNRCNKRIHTIDITTKCTLGITEGKFNKYIGYWMHFG